MLHIQTDNFTINEIRTRGERHFIYNNMYQRTEVWKPYQKRLLIDSILRGYPIGILFLRRNGNKFEVLDGQQRLKALFKFLQNDLPTDEESPLGIITFRELQRKSNKIADFLAFKIPYTLIETQDEQIVGDVFTRLQEGTPLNVAEKLHAYTVAGKMKKFVVDVADNHPLFKKIGITPKRFAHREIVANLALFELDGDLDSLDFPSFRFPAMKKMYKENERRMSSGTKTIRHKLNFLKNILDDSTRMLKDKGNFLQFYFLASRLYDKYGIDRKNYPKFKRFLVGFLANVKGIADEQKDVFSKNPYARYAARTAGTTENMAEKFKILSKTFFNNFPNLKLTDDSRGFDIGQKIAIYYKDKELCFFCGKKVKWENAEFHHKKFHCNGGLTVISNGKLAHEICHKKYHRKKGKQE